jgi:hypothetical protein
MRLIAFFLVAYVYEDKTQLLKAKTQVWRINLAVFLDGL